MWRSPQNSAEVVISRLLARNFCYLAVVVSLELFAMGPVQFSSLRRERERKLVYQIGVLGARCWFPRGKTAEERVHWIVFSPNIGPNLISATIAPQQWQGREVLIWQSLPFWGPSRPNCDTRKSYSRVWLHVMFGGATFGSSSRRLCNSRNLPLKNPTKNSFQYHKRTSDSGFYSQEITWMFASWKRICGQRWPVCGPFLWPQIPKSLRASLCGSLSREMRHMNYWDKGVQVFCFVFRTWAR